MNCIAFRCCLRVVYFGLKALVSVSSVHTRCSVALQDFCICIEMFLAALGHYFSFSYRPFIDAAATYNDCWHSFWSMWDVSDVQRDVAEHIRHVGQYDVQHDDQHLMMFTERQFTVAAFVSLALFFPCAVFPCIFALDAIFDSLLRPGPAALFWQALVANVVQVQACS